MHSAKKCTKGQRSICPYTILQKRFNFKPNPVLIQIFVDYADFYVNTIMSTYVTFAHFTFIIFDYFTRYSSSKPSF